MVFSCRDKLTELKFMAGLKAFKFRSANRKSCNSAFCFPISNGTNKIKLQARNKSLLASARSKRLRRRMETSRIILGESKIWQKQKNLPLQKSPRITARAFMGKRRRTANRLISSFRLRSWKPSPASGIAMQPSGFFLQFFHRKRLGCWKRKPNNFCGSARPENLHNICTVFGAALSLHTFCTIWNLARFLHKIYRSKLPPIATKHLQKSRLYCYSTGDEWQ